MICVNGRSRLLGGSRRAVRKRKNNLNRERARNVVPDAKKQLGGNQQHSRKRSPYLSGIALGVGGRLRGRCDRRRCDRRRSRSRCFRLRRRLCRAREGLEPFASWYSASLNALWYTFLERVSPGPFQKCDHLETSASVHRTASPPHLAKFANLK